MLFLTLAGYVSGIILFLFSLYMLFSVTMIIFGVIKEIISNR